MRASVPEDLTRITSILHLAMLSSVVIYLGVLLMLARTGWQGATGNEGFDGATLQVFVIALGVISVMELGLAWILPRLLMNEQRIRQVMLSARENPLREALAWARVPFIIRLAILDSIAIYGLVIGVLAQDVSYFYPFGGVAVVAMALSRFNPEPVLRVYERLAAEQGWPMQPGA